MPRGPAQGRFYIVRFETQCRGHSIISWSNLFLFSPPLHTWMKVYEKMRGSEIGPELQGLVSIPDGHYGTAASDL